MVFVGRNVERCLMILVFLFSIVVFGVGIFMVFFVIGKVI